jgi:hypothetical protein
LSKAQLVIAQLVIAQPELAHLQNSIATFDVFKVKTSGN